LELRQGPVAAVDASARRAPGALPALRSAGLHSVDAAPGRPEQAGLPHVGVHGVPGVGRAPGARLTPPSARRKSRAAARRRGLALLLVLSIALALTLAEVVLRAAARRT